MSDIRNHFTILHLTFICSGWGRCYPDLPFKSIFLEWWQRTALSGVSFSGIFSLLGGAPSPKATLHIQWLVYMGVQCYGSFAFRRGNSEEASAAELPVGMPSSLTLWHFSSTSPNPGSCCPHLLAVLFWEPSPINLPYSDFLGGFLPREPGLMACHLFFFF